ncbi:HD-GYP domain-containing protein [Rhizobium sp. SSA_523]|uniref:HD-GYP domain-containing protein n=1 Tax=Rhizobium sp. SSA_523 TaxID=2952477 RepID=UPI002091C79D|nr:HD domain-containing phosphohydrolase [Rhizobium sp. SSA_523]MCO5730581.1 response regulator [Rhizobium sp. SSA_523]WKC24583.1 response regulator [Rhizobium sp. SSA_523]
MKILVVDDNKTNLTLLKKLAGTVEGCSAVGFISPEDALHAMPELDFDIGVIDFQMPVYNGVDLLLEIRRFEKYRDKPFVVVTADGDTQTRMSALNAGAIDFLTKPVNPLEFRARIRNLAALTDARNQLADRADWLRREVDKVVQELREREQEIIYRLTLAASYKDPETALHTMRVGAYSELIAKAYGLSAEACADLRLAAPMHDIGKVGIPDNVLLKRGIYTESERSQMQCHTSIGSQILGQSRSSLLQLAAEIAEAHHERWDGQGYPRRKKGEDIPLAGRIVAVADSFDALTTVRPYKPAWSVDKAVSHIREKAGSQFDPNCVKAFEKALPEIIAIMTSQEPHNISLVAAAE